MDIIKLHNKKARKAQELDDERRAINQELSNMSKDIIKFVKEQPIEEQVKILSEMEDSNVTYDLFHELEKTHKLR